MKIILPQDTIRRSNLDIRSVFLSKLNFLTFGKKLFLPFVKSTTSFNYSLEVTPATIKYQHLECSKIIKPPSDSHNMS